MFRVVYRNNALKTALLKWITGFNEDREGRPSTFCNCFLFPKCKMAMRGQHWDEVEAVTRETTRYLKNLTSEAFQGCFQQWTQRWNNCIATNGKYSERNNFDVPFILQNKVIIPSVCVVIGQAAHIIGTSVLIVSHVQN